MGNKSEDFYAVLGIDKECSPTELKNAYKKLAMRWHPDRCSASVEEEANTKFQAIQHAYTVLSDPNKRFMYDVGVYDSDDDDENGMGNFLNEMAAMMNQTKPNENGEESFEQLQELFDEMFQGDMDSFGNTNTTFPSSYPYGTEIPNQSGKCNSSSGKTNMEGLSGFNVDFKSFCVGVEREQDHRRKGNKVVVVEGDARGRAGASSSNRRGGRKQKVSAGHDVSTNDFGIVFAS
jgi:DnaJ family protein B protein 6